MNTFVLIKPIKMCCRSRSSPERFTVDADFLKDVFQKLWRALLDHMLDPQTRFQILQKSLQEPNKVLCCANGTGHCL